MTITADITSSSTSVTAPAGDHVISIATAAAELGSADKPLKDATIRRYLSAGKLQRLAGGVSADSVAAYATRRTANITRTRFRPAAAYRPANPIEAACARYAAGTELARQGDRDKRAARKTLDVIDDGQYGPWLVERVASSREVVDLAEITRVFAELGRDVPMRTVAASLRVACTG